MFKLPEHLRDNNYPFCQHGGVFNVPKKGDIRELKVIASDGAELDPPYEHVSVTLNTKYITSKTPNWYEMCYVKKLFWDDEDVVIQLHIPSCQAVNVHPGCLHLWRCPSKPVELPWVMTV